MKLRKETTGYEKMYRCPLCDELCETKAEAKSHCTSEIECVYTCDECGEEFDTATLAKNCCPTWMCQECGDVFYSEKPKCDCSC